MSTSGDVYATDITNHVIRFKSSSGSVTVVGQTLSGALIDGTATVAKFYNPYGLALDSMGNIYVADTGNNCIRKINSALVVSTFAGSATAGSANGQGVAAGFNQPHDVSVDANMNLYVADKSNNKIRMVTSSGYVTTVAGSGASATFKDGLGTIATFNQPNGIAVDTNGNLYVADYGWNTIRKISPSSVVTTLAGIQSSTYSWADGFGTSAQFNGPWDVSVDTNGVVYATDTWYSLVRMIMSSGMVTTIGGATSPTTTGLAYSDGLGTNAKFYGPYSIALSANGDLFVADTLNNYIRKMVRATCAAGKYLSSDACVSCSPGLFLVFSHRRLCSCGLPGPYFYI